MHTTRNRRASGRTKPRATAKPKPAAAPFLLRPPAPLPAFPSEIRVPPHRGPVVETIDFSYPVLTPLALKKTKPPPKKKPTAKMAPKPRKRKAAPRKAKAISLPAAAEPLTEVPALLPPAAPPPLAPGRSLAPYRPGGLIGLIGEWLGGRARRLAGLLLPRKSPPVRTVMVRTHAAPDELARLRAENERLRLQIEALLALQQGNPAA